MKRIITILIGILAFYSCDKEGKVPYEGFLTGTVKYTGASNMEVDNVIITLSGKADNTEEISKRITKDGKYELKIPAGTYIMELKGNRCKSDELPSEVKIIADKPSIKDINIEQLPSSMVILYNDRESKSGDTISLGGGGALDIWNRYSSNELEWNIRAIQPWIVFEETKGTVPSGGRKSVVFRVDRTKMTSFGYQYSEVILTTGDAGSFTVIVNVNNPAEVTGVSLNKTDLTLHIGETEQLTATVSPSNAANKTVMWGSNNASIATVSNSGLITAMSPGTAIITVTTVDGNKTAQCMVTVIPPIELNVSVSTINATYIAGNHQFNLTSNSSWTISSNQPWCTVQPASGSGNRDINVSLTENTGEASRAALLTITAGGESKQVSIVQDAKGSPVFGNGIIAAASFGGGNGTQSSPYIIHNARQLKKLVDDFYLYDTNKPYYAGAYFKLTTDIQVTANEWIPIGYNYSFSGNFDGNGHSISGTIKSSFNSRNDFGFFGWIASGCTISNLTISATVINESNNSSSISRGWKCTGAIAGRSDGVGVSINNCHVIGTVISGASFGAFFTDYNMTGGIIGQIRGSEGTAGAVIQNCTVSGNITGGKSSTSFGSATGGIVGENYNGSILNCTVSGKIAGGGDSLLPGMGGIVGHNWGDVTNCTVSASGEIISQKEGGHTGGIVGVVFSGKISNCTNNASVTGNAVNSTSTGGLIGLCQGVGVIHTSLNTGNITGSAGNTGGLVGWYLGGNVYSCCTNRGLVNGQTANTNNQIGSFGHDKKEVDMCTDGHVKR